MIADIRNELAVHGWPLHRCSLKKTNKKDFPTALRIMILCINLSEDVELLEKKDYRYVIVLLFLVIIGIITFYYGTDQNQIVSYIGFAGTLISIVLAISAIIYSYYQSSVYGSANEKLDASAKRIESVTESLDNVNEQISKQLSETILEIKDSLERTVYTVNEGLMEISSTMREHFDQNEDLKLTIERMEESLIETNYSLVNVLGQGSKLPSSAVSESDLKGFIENYVRFQSEFSSVFLYYLVKIHQMNRAGNIHDLIAWMIENGLAYNHTYYLEAEEQGKLMVFNNNMGIFWAMYFQLRNGGFLDLKGSVTNTIVESIHSDLEGAIISQIDRSTVMNAEILESFRVIVEKCPQVNATS